MKEEEKMCLVTGPTVQIETILRNHLRWQKIFMMLK